MKENRSSILALMITATLVLAPSLALVHHSLAIGSPPAQEQSRVLAHPEVKILPSKANRWALVIGVDKYEDENISALRGATNDANAIAKALKDYAGFQENQIIVLTNEQTRNRQPTRLNILKYLSNLKALVPKDGLLLLSFSGHGIENNRRAFIIPSDAVYTEDIKLLQQTAIDVETIKDNIKDTGASQVLILLDACRNDPLNGRADSVNPLTETYVRAFDFDLRNQEVTAFATLYATSVGARAYEDAQKREGYFTLAVVEGLSGKAANPETGEVTLRNLLKYIETTVPVQVALDLGSSKRQQPFAIIEGYKADELVLAVGSSAKGESPGRVLLSGERALWQEVERSDTQQSYADFMKVYPRSEYTAVAEFRLRRLSEQAAIGIEQWKRGLALQNDNLDEAVKSFTRAIESNPKFSEPYGSRAAALSRRLEFDKAIADYTTAIELSPKSATAYYGRGLAYENKREFNRAIADFTSSIELLPSLFTFLSRGRAYSKIGMFDLAIANYFEALAKDQTTSGAVYYHSRGQAYLSKKDYEHSLADFNRAIELIPSESEFYNSRGQCYFAKKEYQNAIGDYSRALQWRPGVVGVARDYNSLPHNYHNNRALVYFVMGDYDRALTDFTRAIELDPADATTFLNRANVHEARGDAHRAKADRKTAKDLEGSRETSSNLVGGTINTLGEQPIGGLVLDLDGYCKGVYGRSSLAVLLEKNAFGWKCETDDQGQKKYSNIDMGAACKKQFGPAAVGRYSYYNDGNSWFCGEGR